MNQTIVKVFTLIKLYHRVPGLFREPSENGGGCCGLQAASKIRRRRRRAPKAIPRMATFGIEAAIWCKVFVLDFILPQSE